MGATNCLIAETHLSVMGAVTPSGKLYTLVRQESFNGLHSIIFLDHLLRQTGGNLLVIWDGSPIHRRTEVNDFVAEVGPKRLRLERLPYYAPELNPVEVIWQHLKNIELRNLACLDLEQLQLELHLAIGRLRHMPKLIQSFFAWAGLSLDKV
jgi:transposase